MIKESFLTSRWDQLIKNQDVESILKEPNLFWITFCKATNRDPKEHFFINMEGSIIHITAHSEVLKSLKASIEKVRTLFLSHFQDKENGLLLISSDDSETVIHNPLDITDRISLSSVFYQTLIHPHWESLSSLLEANYCFKILTNNEAFEIFEISLAWRRID